MTYELCALCAAGLEKLVGNELRKLGLKMSGEPRQAGMVFFHADEAGMAAANLWLRAAERVLLVAGRFRARDFDELFNGFKEVEWELFARKDVKISIERVRTVKSSLSSVPAIQSVAQKAIYRHLGDAWRKARLEETGTELGIRLYLHDNQAVLGIDLSGDPLHKRGYRRITGPAPLKETIAAGLLLNTQWKRSYALYDPFCGTGTIPIEAALFACNVAPGIARGFAFRNMPFWNDEVFLAERRKAVEAIRLDVDISITGTDAEAKEVEAAEQNLKTAASLLRGLGVKEAERLEKAVSFSQLSMEEAKATAAEGYILANPPWGDRLRDLAYAENLYRQMRHLKKDFPGWGMGLVTTYPDFGLQFGAEPESVREVQNGQDKAYFYRYAPGALGD